MAVYIECINTLKQRLAAVDTAIVAMLNLQTHYQKVGYPASPGAPFDAKGEHGPGAMDVNVCLVCGSEEGERHSLKLSDRSLWDGNRRALALTCKTKSVNRYRKQ